MDLFRIIKQKYSEDLSGLGAKLFGGRWNTIGTPALYCSETRALATLELLVHTKNEILPSDLKILLIKIPTKIKSKIIQIDTLPKNWNSLQVSETTQEVGKKHFADNNCLGIRVPSAIINMEYNVVLNPNYKDYDLIKIENIDNFIIDNRLIE